MNYWEWSLKPVKIADDIYYVGTRKGPSHLIKTKDGLVLIDSGWPQSLYMLLENIKSIGFDYHNIKHIVHTHGHIDHFGGTRALVEICGAKTYIGIGDEDAVRGLNELSYCKEVGRELEEPFIPDVLIKDGDEIDFGGVKIKFVSTPGHTAGTLSFFVNLTWKGKKYYAGMFGGAGLNTLQDDYLSRYNLPYSCRNDYLQSVERLLKYNVDIHLGNHVRDNEHLTKMNMVTEDSNPFIDNKSWRKFLLSKKSEIEKLMNK